MIRSSREKSGRVWKGAWSQSRARMRVAGCMMEGGEVTGGCQVCHSGSQCRVGAMVECPMHGGW